jgi:hypothetical protein
MPDIYKAQHNSGFGWAVCDTQQPDAHAVCWVDEGFNNGAAIAEAIAAALNAQAMTFNLEHEYDRQ